MRGFTRFLGKEALEAARTWRLPVVAGFALFFALTGPILADFTPELVKSLSGSSPGLVIEFPEPTFLDAYMQWISNLSEIVAFVIVIVGAGGIAGEVAAGTTALVLTKPVSRSGFVVAKVVVQFLLAAVTVTVCTALTQAVTLAVFGTAPADALWLATGVWLVYAALLIALVTVFSAVMPTLAAAGTGVGAMLALSIAALWGPLVKYSPAGLAPAPMAVITGKDPELLWPIVSGVAATALLVAVAAALFSRREL